MQVTPKETASHSFIMLKVRIQFAQEEGDELIHPFSFGQIVLETFPAVPPPQDKRDAFFLLTELTELLHGLSDFLISPRIKKYVFSSSSSFDLVFEKRKHSSVALKCKNLLLNVYPEAQIYSAFHEALEEFLTEYRHRFLLSDGKFDESIEDVLDAFFSAVVLFNQRRIRASKG